MRTKIKTVAGIEVFVDENGRFHANPSAGPVEAATLDTLRKKIVAAEQGVGGEFEVFHISSSGGYYDDDDEEAAEVVEGVFVGYHGTTGQARLRFKDGRIAEVGGGWLIPASKPGSRDALVRAFQAVNDAAEAKKKADRTREKIGEKLAVEVESHGRRGADRAVLRAKKTLAALEKLAGKR